MACNRLEILISCKSTLKNLNILKNYVKGCSTWSHTRQKSNSSVISHEEILSEANKQNCLQLLNASTSGQFFTSKTVRKAAVLVPLCQFNGQLALLYTVRALHLKVNGGEIAFPGGRFDETDGTLENTALREAHEEIGINPKKVDVWGKGPEIHRPDIKVTPVIGYIGQLCLENLKINPNEVSLVFLATLEHLSSSTNFRVTRFRSRKKYVFQTPVYFVTNKRIWGLTAYITHIVLSSLIPEIYKKNIKFRPQIERILHG